MSDLAKITNKDRKHAHQFLMIVKRNAYGGNIMAAEGALARILSEERERVAVRLEALSWTFEADRTSILLSIQDFIKELRGEDEPQVETAPCSKSESLNPNVSEDASEPMECRVPTVTSESSEGSVPVSKSESVQVKASEIGNESA